MSRSLDNQIGNLREGNDMKLWKSAVFAGFLAAAPLTAQAEPGVWQLADEDTTIYLFGSYHALPVDFDWRTEAFNRVLREVEAVYFEAPIDDETAALMRARLDESGRFDDGERLSDFLDADTIAQLRVTEAQVGLPTEFLEPYKPWYAALMITVFQAVALGYDPSTGVEIAVRAEAEVSGIRMGGLETLEEHLSLFAEMSDATGMAFLRSVVREREGAGQLLDDMRAAWDAQDLQRLALMAEESFTSDDVGIAQRLLWNRNANWIPRIESLLDQPGKVMVVVGATHLGGERGVIMLLEARGHSVLEVD